MTGSLAMDHSFKMVEDWRNARQVLCTDVCTEQQRARTLACKWKPPLEGVIKVNVDASLFKNSDTFKIGMVARNHRGEFMAGKVICLVASTSVLEAEALGVREALSWIKEQHLQQQRVEVESDSLLVVRAIKGGSSN